MGPFALDAHVGASSSTPLQHKAAQAAPVLASGPGRPGPASRALRRKPYINWRLFGRHPEYANGTPRSLLRGWPHVLALATLELLLLAGSAGLGILPPMPPRAATLARWTTLGFYASVLFHLVPYAREESYNIALSADFMAITCDPPSEMMRVVVPDAGPRPCVRLGFTGQVAAWVGLLSWPGLLSVALSLAKLALCVSGLLQSSQPLWQFHRTTRRNIVLAQFALTSVVEAFVIPNKALVAAIWAAKWAAFTWYVTYGRHDAKPSALTWAPTVWADHDYFHLLAIITAALQLSAAASMGI